MSALDLIPDAELASEPVTKPPTRWRNLYVAVGDYDQEEGPSRVEGEKWWGKGLWPSREVAEQVALEHIEELADPEWGPYDRWVDAYPAGERPE